ncbi:MAG: MoaD/ThiS family protein [Acidobacteria bacterium]|nr:MoaD/ThiS family protein [Acidobacteriota bacterium]
MTISVLFFGATADAAGTRARAIESGESTVGELVDRITNEIPGLSRHKLLFSVNQEYVAAETQLEDGDELAIFSPVSGG